ncbi:MAG: dTDP-4-dehydrorhamnose 3,5-epimerase [Gemmatimonadaceae bacterium]
MKVTKTNLPGVLLIEPMVFDDGRGFFMESFNVARYADVGINEAFVQDNVSRSGRGVLRGLHLQHPHGQAKLVSVLEGEVFDVAVDVRVGSPTFGRWCGEHLSAYNKRQLYIPAGFAHGFVVTSDSALFTYKCTDFYHPETERSVRWDDPRIGIKWPASNVELSVRDREALPLDAIGLELLPPYVE